MTSERLYSIWIGIKQRCENPRCDLYRHYGGRGIVLCREWYEFATFRIWALHSGYEPTLTIERCNNDGPYSPDNCKWANTAEQQRNKRSNVFVTAFGETKCLMDWVTDERCKVIFETLRRRVRDGMVPEDAITTGPFEPKTHCPQGHALDEHNTYWYRGHARCKACNRDNARKYAREQRD